jgi:hypothetical protein
MCPPRSLPTQRSVPEAFTRSFHVFHDISTLSTIKHPRGRRMDTPRTYSDTFTWCSWFIKSTLRSCMSLRVDLEACSMAAMELRSEVSLFCAANVNRGELDRGALGKPKKSSGPIRTHWDAISENSPFLLSYLMFKNPNQHGAIKRQKLRVGHVRTQSDTFGHTIFLPKAKLVVGPEFYSSVLSLVSCHTRIASASPLRITFKSHAIKRMRQNELRKTHFHLASFFPYRRGAVPIPPSGIVASTASRPVPSRPCPTIVSRSSRLLSHLSSIHLQSLTTLSRLQRTLAFWRQAEIRKSEGSD